MHLSHEEFTIKLNGDATMAREGYRFFRRPS